MCDAEALIIQLVLSGHLKEIFHSTAYAINVYLQLGPQAVRLTRLARVAVETGSGPKIECAFIQRTPGKSKAAPKKQATKSSGGGRKGKSKATISDEDEDQEAQDLSEKIRQEVVSADSEDLEDADGEGWSYSMMPRRKNGQGTKPSVSSSSRKRRKIISDDDSDDDVIVLSD
ncbi:hypothetical protein BN14_04686 [Rhizoctonia solani AG-1 IB]|uniref:Uncharacterized protein n=1 Tax=Thanatephorus cucumeris (strain AG1-IB / isolate 7/3/14) TaxID=1108050 RepID=M5BTW0_THACB|nr:hypothetical protein BN14_04686 [Rhizoctonia solani AG-1 IB]